MTDARLLHRASRWLALANEDLRLARHAFSLGTCAPYRLIAFHAQQCAEKSLKAELVANGIDFPYSHDIARLLELCRDLDPRQAGIEEADALTVYAVAARYDFEDSPVTLAEARRAVEMAGAVLAVFSARLRAHGVAVPGEDQQGLVPGSEQARE